MKTFIGIGIRLRFLFAHQVNVNRRIRGCGGDDAVCVILLFALKKEAPEGAHLPRFSVGVGPIKTYHLYNALFSGRIGHAVFIW